MNERFKFRCWDKLKSRYLISTVFDEYDTYNIMTLDGEFIRHIREDGEYSYPKEFYDEKNYIIEQCTGLKDKNGKLVYTGDIFKLHDGRIRTIREVKGGFTFESFDDEVNKKMIDYESLSDMQTASYFESQCEIIGNIHENKDILNENN